VVPRGARGAWVLAHRGYTGRTLPRLAGVQFSVGLMVLGAFIAALDDLGFDLYGYVLIFFNDFFTAASGVIAKQKMETKKLGPYGYAGWRTRASERAGRC